MNNLLNVIALTSLTYKCIKTTRYRIQLHIGIKMAKHVLLNNIHHKDLKIITTHSAALGDKVNGALTFPTEFREVQSEYPIFFQKAEETGQFQAVAIFGFTEGQNLFLDDSGWHASYIPAVISRGPFLIGYQNEQQDGETVRVPMIHIDLDNPRVSQTEGEAVFLTHGGNSPYLEKVSRTLAAIHEGIDASKAMFDAFIALELIESFILDVKFNDGTSYKFGSYYTINEEKLVQLDKETLSQLNSAGYLFAAYMVIASLSNIKKLVDKRNALFAQ